MSSRSFEFEHFCFFIEFLKLRAIQGKCAGSMREVLRKMLAYAIKLMPPIMLGSAPENSKMPALMRLKYILLARNNSGFCINA